MLVFPTTCNVYLHGYSGFLMIKSDFFVVKKLGVNGLLKVINDTHILPLSKTLNLSDHESCSQNITLPSGSSTLKAGNGKYSG